MKLEESQLSYLFKRNKEYDRKYGMFKHLISELHDVNSVIELFGGTGIETQYIKKYLHPSKHVVCEQNEECCDILERNNDIELFRGDCFEYKNNEEEFDLLVIDSVFNKKEFFTIISLINNYNYKYLIITNTGVFHVRFCPELTYHDYWQNLINDMEMTLNVKHQETVYDYDFGIMLFSKTPCVNHNANKNIYTDSYWRTIRDNITAQNK